MSANLILFIIVLILISGTSVSLFIEQLKKNKSLKNEIAEKEKEAAILRDEIKTIRSDYAKNNKAKETMETGSAQSDFNNSINILQHLKK